MCEDRIMIIICLIGIIFIEEVMFGRMKNSSVCIDLCIFDMNCIFMELKVIIKSKCDGELECSIDVENGKFGGDFCFGIFKYLEVNFICY